MSYTLTKPGTPAIQILRPHRIYLVALVLGCAGHFSQPSLAQPQSEITIPLQISSPYVQSMMVAWITFDQNGSNTAAPAKIGSVRLGNLPGGLRVAVETIAESPNVYQVRIDTNGDGDLSNESPSVIKVDSSFAANVTRRWRNGKTLNLPYTLSYSRRADGTEMFHWRPNYAAEGKLKIGNCHVDITLLDVNGDGVFDRQDFSNATTIHIDDGTPEATFNLNDPRIIKHSDGSIEIPDELRRSFKKKWLRGEEILELCDSSYLVDRIEPDGSTLTLAKTDLRIAKVGEPLPQLVMTTLDDRVVDTESFKGAITLIDFWASWCGVCVEKFPAVKEIVAAHKGRLKVIAINVDESERLPLARQIIEKYSLNWPQVARGRGERDPLWKVFGSMSNNGLSVPLYVLVDQKGTIRYGGDGQADLSELRSQIAELLQDKSGHAQE